jgi:hypothetical protein
MFMIGDKAKGLVPYVQVEDATSSWWPLDMSAYIERGLQPRLDSLPWREDWSSEGGQR